MRSMRFARTTRTNASGPPEETTIMRYLHIALSSLILGGLSVAACGDDSTDDMATGGSTSTGGASGSIGTGGSAGSGVSGGTGGSATGGSATGGSATGGSATGGSATGGFAGSATGGAAGSGVSGSGGMGTGCPGTAPMDGAMCNTDDNPDDCNYGTSVCECGGPPMGPEGTWSCSVCPGTAPMNGSMCDEEMNSSTCTFGTTECDCNGPGGGPGGGGGGADGEGATWECVTCPATEPMDGSTCDSEMNDECDYGMTTCECGGDDTWECD
jgi:hypothetical protein